MLGALKEIKSRLDGQAEEPPRPDEQLTVPAEHVHIRLTGN